MGGSELTLSSALAVSRPVELDSSGLVLTCAKAAGYMLELVEQTLLQSRHCVGHQHQDGALASLGAWRPLEVPALAIEDRLHWQALGGQGRAPGSFLQGSKCGHGVVVQTSPLQPSHLHLGHAAP
eukprot:363159-Chlamydomonas_euryale.AAC.9